jgi:hypothetical protein
MNAAELSDDELGALPIVRVPSAERQLATRAAAAYYRIAGHDHGSPPPAIASVRVCDLDGKRYVVVQNVNAALEVYRVRPSDGVLRRMRRWPKAIESA